MLFSISLHGMEKYNVTDVNYEKLNLEKLDGLEEPVALQLF